MNLLGKAEASGQDPYLALLTYCSTPIDNSLPLPAQLPNHRDYPTQLPISEWLQCSQALASHTEQLQNRQNIQRRQYDSRSTLELRKPISRWGGSGVPAKNQHLDSRTGEGRGQWPTVLHTLYSLLATVVAWPTLAHRPLELPKNMRFYRTILLVSFY